MVKAGGNDNAGNLVIRIDQSNGVTSGPEGAHRLQSDGGATVNPMASHARGREARLKSYVQETFGLESSEVYRTECTTIFDPFVGSPSEGRCVRSSGAACVC
jgi:hypothetical protein